MTFGGWNPENASSSAWESIMRNRELPPSEGVDAVLADLERGEAPIRLKDLPAHPLVPRRDGRKVHISVVHRWALAGLKGVRLETARCGGARCTTASAIHRFYRRSSGVETSPTAPTPHRREKQLALVETELEGCGL